MRQNRRYYQEIKVNPPSPKKAKWKFPNKKQPEIVTIEDDDYTVLKEGPLRSLWLGKTVPMIRPSQGIY